MLTPLSKHTVLRLFFRTAAKEKPKTFPPWYRTQTKSETPPKHRTHLPLNHTKNWRTANLIQQIHKPSPPILPAALDSTITRLLGLLGSEQVVPILSGLLCFADSRRIPEKKERCWSFGHPNLNKYRLFEVLIRNSRFPAGVSPSKSVFIFHAFCHSATNFNYSNAPRFSLANLEMPSTTCKGPLWNMNILI